MNEDELRELVSILKERRQSPQKRRSQNTKIANKLSGKTFDADRFA